MHVRRRQVRVALAHGAQRLTAAEPLVDALHVEAMQARQLTQLLTLLHEGKGVEGGRGGGVKCPYLCQSHGRQGVQLNMVLVWSSEHMSERARWCALVGA